MQKFQTDYSSDNSGSTPCSSESTSSSFGRTAGIFAELSDLLLKLPGVEVGVEITKHRRAVKLQEVK